jgi:DNA-binding CsgD family transcriptional regulator
MKKERLKDNLLVNKLLSCLGNDKPLAFQIELMSRLLSQITVIHQLILDARLTEREQACLLLAAQGYSAKETANLLNCEITTIQTHRKAILMKLKCSNMTQAVFVGIRYGYLDK